MANWSKFQNHFESTFTITPNGFVSQLEPKLVGQLSKYIVHFVIKAPNLAQVYITILQTFSDIGPPPF